MGDRANVAILSYSASPVTHYGKPEVEGEVDAVVLYTHWGGTDLPIDVQTALTRRERWDDPAYLARIVFCRMIGDSLEDGTGFGITANSLSDNSYPILVLDCQTERIASRNEDDWRRPVRDPEGIPFAEYVRLSEAKVRAFRR
jgi:hypothetical protein